MNHGETGNLSTLGGSTKIIIKQPQPVMSYVLVQKLQKCPDKQLFLLDTRFQLPELIVQM